MAIMKRRKARDISQQFREAVWPSMGWTRTFHYYRHRLFRTGDSTYRITAGLAAGVAVSWTPFWGTHFIQAAFFSWLIRGNILAGIVGTAWGNPWTFYFMILAGYHLGVFVCRLFGMDEFVGLPNGMDFTYFVAHPWEFFEFLFDNPLSLLLPVTIGGYLCGLLAWPVSYVLLYLPVRAARKAYRLQRMRRFRKRKAEKVKIGPQKSGKSI